MTHIANNIPIMTAFADVDLRLIEALWNIRNRKPRALRPSDRAAIRQSVAAVQRLGARLIDRLGGAGVMTCRALPQITHLTRIRKAPKRLWLEIRSADGADAPVLFLEFTPGDLAIGLHVPCFATAEIRKDTWTRFRKHKPQIYRSLKQKRSEEDAPKAETGSPARPWLQSKRRPPVFVVPGATVLDGGARPGAVTLSRSLGAQALDLDAMVQHLHDAVEIFAPFLDADDDRPTAALLRAFRSMDVPQAMRLS